MSVPRRVVTGHVDGRSVILSDAAAPKSHSIPGATFHELWNTTAMPAPVTPVEPREPTDRPLITPPDPHGTIIRIVDLEPGAVSPMHRTESIERISRLAGDGDPDGFETAWETNVVREAVAALPAAERTVMRLTYYDALTHQEIAHHLAIPIGTVKSRTARAHARLRASVKPRVALAS